MGGHYEKDIMRQLQEVMARLDKTEQEVKDTKKSWKKEVREIKADFAVERKQLKTKIKNLVVLCQDNGHIKPLFFSKISKMHKLVAFIPRFA